MDDSRVFDVSKPNKVAATPTSRPIITSSEPIMSDPMVKDESALPDSLPGQTSSGNPIQIKINDDEENVDVNSSSSFQENPVAASDTEAKEENDPPEDAHLPESPEEHPTGYPEPSEDEPESAAPYSYSRTPSSDQEPKQESGKTSGHDFSSFSSILRDNDAQKLANDSKHEAGSTINPSTSGDGNDNWQQQIPPLNIPSGAGPRKKGKKLLGLVVSIVLLILVGAYLAIDAGLISSNINLPFHIFNKQKKTTATTPPTAQTTPPAPTPTPALNSQLPAGFTEYKITATPVSFAYPTEWGRPTATKVDGYSKVGDGNKADGVLAYQIKFASNKDIEVTTTSSKYLSSSTSTTKEYFAYLQWCKGTNDDKFYQQVLNSATSRGVTTPTTIACDQGPLQDDAKALDSTTLLQPNRDKVAASDPAGDFYVKNLEDKEWAVLRVVDVSMKNGDNVKKLLDTIKVSVSSANSSSNSSTENSSTEIKL